MRTVTFASVHAGVTTRNGLEPRRNVQANQAAAIAQYIGDRLAKYWEQAA
jgi:hypothetical protein